jgi:hypothetical protein
MMVSLILMSMVFFALHSVLDASVRALNVAKDHNEVASNARPAMERMEREMRAAYSADAATCAAGATQPILSVRTASQTTFCTNGVSPSGISEPQLVSYYNKTNASNGTVTLIRKQGAVERIMAVLGPTSPTPTGSVSFAYYNATNIEVNPATAAESSIYMVRITLTAKTGSSGLNQNDSMQTLTSYISLRNR